MLDAYKWQEDLKYSCIRESAVLPTQICKQKRKRNPAKKKTNHENEPPACSVTIRMSSGQHRCSSGNGLGNARLSSFTITH